MKTRQTAGCLLLILLSVFIGAPLRAEEQENTPRLGADPLASYYSENFDPDDWRSQLELAYWAGGETGSSEAAVIIADAIDELNGLTRGLDSRGRGEAVLEFIHDRFLTRYVEPQSGLDVLLSTGRFNCLSSAVLYSILGTAVGLDIDGVNTVDHAFCTVVIDDQKIDVETTNPRGFDPGTKKEFHDDFGRTTGFSYVPAANYRDRTAVDTIGLFALLLQNRIADAESEGRYYDAVGISVDRWVLLGGGSGQEFEDLVIRMLNYGTLLSRAGREEDALS